MNQDIGYSRHARRRMRWRRITEEEVEDTISNPDRTEFTRQGRTNAFKLIGSRHIRVTFRESGTGIVVVTVVDLSD